MDLIVTSPPYFALRSYRDGGEHYAGQVGGEPTPAAYIASLVECTREWMRVLKPTGSLWINLGDKYAPTKSLLGLPWRYALACIDDLGLILRAEVVWSKPNGLPESVVDRVRRSHEQWFHFVKQPRYFAAVDEIRGPHVRPQTRGTDAVEQRPASNPLGKLPGSVWTIATEPLKVPDALGVDHFAAFPTEWPRRIISGWSPSGVCVECGQGRRPVRASEGTTPRQMLAAKGGSKRAEPGRKQGLDWQGGHSVWRTHYFVGYACDCTPYVDVPGTGGSSGVNYETALAHGKYATTGANWGGNQDLAARPRVGPRRTYDLDNWTPPPTTPALVVDPFGGTGTVALVASMLGRTGVSVDLSHDYSRLARWRTTDPVVREKLAKKWAKRPAS